MQLSIELHEDTRDLHRSILSTGRSRDEVKVEILVGFESDLWQSLIVPSTAAQRRTRGPVGDAGEGLCSGVLCLRRLHRVA